MEGNRRIEGPSTAASLSWPALDYKESDLADSGFGALWGPVDIEMATLRNAPVFPEPCRHGRSQAGPASPLLLALRRCSQVLDVAPLPM